MTVLLMLVTTFAVLLFLTTLLFYLFQIGSLLMAIGGKPTSLLAKLRMGLRAIEGETCHLGSLLPSINQDLAGIAEGLHQADQHLEHTVDAAAGQAKGKQ